MKKMGGRAGVMLIWNERPRGAFAQAAGSVALVTQDFRCLIASLYMAMMFPWKYANVGIVISDIITCQDAFIWTMSSRLLVNEISWSGMNPRCISDARFTFFGSLGFLINGLFLIRSSIIASNSLGVLYRLESLRISIS